jgi:hypothetical protein
MDNRFAGLHKPKEFVEVVERVGKPAQNAVSSLSAINWCHRAPSIGLANWK